MWNIVQSESDKIKKLISEHPTAEELAQKFRITPAELALRLHSMGKKGYHVFAEEKDGRQILIPGSEYIRNLNLNTQIIADSDEIKLIVCCDAHFGHMDANPDCFKIIGEYSVKDKIYYVVHNGDLIHGVDYYVGRSRIPSEMILPIDRDEQIKYVDSVMPYDPRITYLINNGNHDIYTVSGIAYDFMKDFLEKTKRDDMRVIGFDDTLLKINNDVIRFSHGVNKGTIKNRSKHKALAVFYGGSHVSDYQPYKSTYIKVTQPLSNLDYEKKKHSSSSNGEHKGVFFPGFTRVIIDLNSKHNIENIHWEDYRFNGNKVEYVEESYRKIEKYRARR